MPDVPGPATILRAAANGGVILSLQQAFMLTEAIASSAIEGAAIPDDAGLVRLAKAITEETDHAE